MASRHGPWWTRTWWGKRTTALNVAMAVALLAFVVWKALFP